MPKSKYLASLTAEGRHDLEQRLFEQQSGRCFICNEPIDLVLHKGQIEVDHIDPQAEQGLDAEQNFALTHAACNRNKGISDLRVARRIAEFNKLQDTARRAGRRGANLADVLIQHGGSKHPFRARRNGRAIDYSLAEIGDTAIRSAPLYRDKLSDIDYCFIVLPLAYLHHDDTINPRSIGHHVRALIEEFLQRLPQLHVALGWWAPGEDGSGRVKVFDGQHKAAAQILLGVDALPLRVFIEPDIERLRTANTHAGSTLRQVAIDVAALRHLGSTLYADRVRKYKEMRGLDASDYSFSEAELVRFFRGERKEMGKYIIDAQRDAITHSADNQLLEFVEWAGKALVRPLAYSSVERTFFSEFLCQQALETAIDEGFEEGTNARVLEREQIVRLMNLFAQIFFIGKWDPEIGGRRIEDRLKKGEKLPELHLRAWRVAREEVLANILRWVRLVLENYFAFTGKVVDRDRIMHVRLTDDVWQRIDNFLVSLSKLPCWIDPNLGSTVFGPKQNLDFFKRVFETGIAPNGIRVLSKPLDIAQMIQAPKG